MKKEKTMYLFLKYLRNRLNIKQYDFAQLIGVAPCQYGKKENGEQPWFLNECELIRGYINKELKKKGEDPLTIDEIFVGEKVSKKTHKAG